MVDDSLAVDITAKEHEVVYCFHFVLHHCWCSLVNMCSIFLALMSASSAAYLRADSIFAVSCFLCRYPQRRQPATTVQQRAYDPGSSNDYDLPSSIDSNLPYSNYIDLPQSTNNDLPSPIRCQSSPTAVCTNSTTRWRCCCCWIVCSNITSCGRRKKDCILRQGS